MIQTKEIKKNQKGITMTSLIIVILLFMIITSISVSTSLDRFQINQLQKMYNDIRLLSDKTSNYYLRYEGLPLLRTEQGEALEYTYTNLNFQKNVNDNNVYYIIDLQAMNGLSLNYGKEGFENPNTSEDVYIINQSSHSIYYVKGIEVDKVTYHTVPEDNVALEGATIPTKPEIKVISEEPIEDGIYTADLKLEFIPGKDNTNGVDRTTYSINNGAEIDITTLENNTLELTEEGSYTIKVKTYNHSQNFSECILLIKKMPATF